MIWAGSVRSVPLPTDGSPRICSGALPAQRKLWSSTSSFTALAFAAGRIARSLRRASDLDEIDRQIARLIQERAIIVNRSERVPVRSLQVGQGLTGIVREIGPFGIFLDVGAQRDGLVPISLISDNYVADVYEEFMPGQKVFAWVAEIKQNGELSLTMSSWRARKRQGLLKQDVSAFLDIAPEEWLAGTLVRISQSRLLVELATPPSTGEPGSDHGQRRVCGFVHESQMIRDEQLQVGQQIQVRVLRVDARGLHLTMRQARWLLKRYTAEGVDEHVPKQSTKAMHVTS
ncbi:unnamed protein product [Durusdinium trenchii]|uniref:S1 motif domain-containing protein n=2 Tax=Durusdinium trenchii TaxID=1381693 RepID=A0ABP0J8R8_9DINO